MKRIAVIGAGISGLSCARTLLEHYCHVEVFEKESIVGGRFATQFAKSNGASISFDHGAQYFTAKADDFKTHVDDWLKNGLVAQWQGRVGKLRNGKLLPEQNAHQRFVGIPHMHALAQHMASKLNVSVNSRVKNVGQKDGKWLLQFEDDAKNSTYDAVIISAPPLQTVPLLKEFKDLQDKCSVVAMNPCWATMVSFESPLPINFDGIFGDEHDALSWICRDSSKPQRPQGERFVLHASNEWTRKHLNENADVVSTALVKEFFGMTWTPPREFSSVQSYLWHYAAPAQTDSLYDLADESKTLRLCGDWSHSGRVEGAFLSGQYAARKIVAKLAG